MNCSVILPFLLAKKRIYTEHLEKPPVGFPSGIFSPDRDDF